MDQMPRPSTNEGFITCNADAGMTPHSNQAEDRSVSVFRNEESVVGPLGETVTKKQPNQSGDEGQHLVNKTDTKDLRVNLTGTFEMEGVYPLKSPPTRCQSQMDNSKSSDHDTVDRIDQSGSPSLADTLPEGKSQQGNCDVPPDSQKPVARVISFDQENVLPNQKISPVTGKDGA